MSPNLIKADQTAEKAHHGQMRDGGDPYITHPRRVMCKIKELGLPEYVQSAALLHDVLENTKLEAQDVLDQFGADVCLLVEGMTKIKGQDYNQQLLSVAIQDPNIVFVKMADRLDNLITMDPWTDNKKLRYLQETALMMDLVFNPIIDQLLTGEKRDKAYFLRNLLADTALRIAEKTLQGISGKN